MVSSVSGSGASNYVGILLSSIAGGSTGSSGDGAGASGPQDTIYLSAQARLLMSIASSLNASQGQATAPGQLLNLAAQLGPVVITGDGAGPRIDVSAAGPDNADADLSRLATLLQTGTDPGASVSSGYFASVATGDGADVIIAGDPTAPADAAGGLKAKISSGAGDDSVTVNGNALVRAGAGNDSITGNGGSLLLSFGRDDGSDSVTANNASLGLLMNDVAESDVLVAKEGNDLVLRINNTNDSITIRNYQAAQQGYIRFADGGKSLEDLTSGLNFSA